MHDLRYALRMLIKSPAFTIIAVLTLALGIGANGAIFSVVNAVLLQQLHYRNPDHLVWIWATRKNVPHAFYSIPNFTDTRNQSRTLERWIALSPWGVNLRGEGETERLQGVRMTAGAMATLGIEPAAGRALRDDDEKPAAAPVVMLSYGLWQRRFGGDPAVIGRTQLLNGETYTVAGILPRDLIIPNLETEIVAPLRMESDPRRNVRGTNFLRLMARLKPGVTPQQAQSELGAITDRLRDQFPEDNGNLTAPHVIKLQDEMTGGYRQGLLVLLGAVGTVLLIACLNLANLQLARASARQREITIRTALGATRWHLIRQLFVEGILLAVAGGTLGLLIATWGKDLLVALSPADFPRAASSIVINSQVLLFCVAVSLLAGVFVGLAPAIYATKSDLHADLKSGGRTDDGSRARSRLRSGLIVAEIALSLVLLVSAGLLIKSFRQLQSVHPGFSLDHALAVRLSLPPANYAGGNSIRIFYDQLAPRLLGLPGVESVGAASALPMSGLNARTEFIISGQPAAKPSDVPGAQHRWVSPGYFHALKIPLVRGRDFVETDNERGAGVVVIDQALARRFFANQNPIGAHIVIRMGDGAAALPDYEIVGIAENVKHVSLDEEAVATFYGPIPQAPKSAVPFLANNFSLVVRTSLDPETLAVSVRRELRRIDADVAVSSVKPMGQFLSASVAARKFNLTLLAAFAGTALLLAASGLYGVIAYLVTQRTREIGVRIALGAQRGDLMRLILRESLALLAIGLAVGLVAALAATQLLRSLLYGVGTTDFSTYAIVIALLSAAAILASLIPARRATNVDPVIALRAE